MNGKDSQEKMERKKIKVRKTTSSKDAKSNVKKVRRRK